MPVFDIEDHFLWHHEGSSAGFNLATDGEVLVQGYFPVPHPDLEFDVLRNSVVRVFRADEPVLVAEYGTPTSQPEQEYALIQGFPVGDVNGDGHGDIVGTDGAVSGVLFFGPHEFQAPASETVHPGPASMVLPSTVGGQFEACDLNRDGLSDLCSTFGFALAPSPFENGSLLASQSLAFTLVDLPGMHAAVLSGAFSKELYWIPAAALPVDAEPAVVASDTIALDGWAVELTVATSGSGAAELVAFITTDDLSARLVAWSLDGALTEQYRIPLGQIQVQWDLESGDWNQDGVADLAVVVDHRIGIFLGPLSATSEPELWWTTPTPSDLALSGYYLAAHGPDLWAYEIATRRLYRIDGPHLPR